MSDLRCSESSLRADEPVAGTAVSTTWRWLALEYRPHWEAKGVERALFPPSVRAWLDAFLALPGTRVQLLRRAGRTGPLACFFADTTPGAARVHRLELQRYEDLLEEPPEAWVDGTTSAPLHTGPLVWVCTHGQRDRCCALHGGRVYTALRAQLGEAVWQTSHLGGHRFAATLLWLPEGLCYGRLRVDDVEGLVAAAARGEVYRLDRLRGRVAWSPAAQAAEVELRRRTMALGIDAVRRVGEQGPKVTLRLGSVTHELEVRPQPLAQPVIASCGKEPAPATGLVVG